ncbi:PAP/fibrillin family protein [Synechococcus sp. CS-1325]|uniref:PAP/fibrillin family protein n=1 Tax=unclassified Synechococcus TaxID=2626047 RepID=UPI000DB24430|nr:MULTISPECIES: PAP/fibrillin family protein [unclassified Synechococcus]PZU95888.1 MAG: PAP fibrillin [Cyanobium sp.]MCT0200653.1 PAP/fibrillin family protein [Synechococcus sp. CS-1325]MCT0212228.1 PAP/fibrillin family protein [Synechococcus sp. CS-1326]MCT0230677.1 PAP/fibrillin family protein [Synechococcus sp. CS-1324]MCT0234359.1 PAP/fibrillin family protein [Synechococcus sp. CS-1327]
MSHRDQLLRELDQPGQGGDRRVETLIQALEQEEPADLERQRALLEGVWELRWSSSRLPYLLVAPWLENLQILLPEQGRGMNLLRPAGPLGALAAISIEASLAVVGPQRVSVAFEQGGWLGPRFGEQRLRLFRAVRQPYPAWLDITVLDQDLRICRGNAGTVFVLKRRTDLRPGDFLSVA